MKNKCPKCNHSLCQCKTDTSLSGKIQEFDEAWEGHIDTKDTKEKIQNAQKRLKKKIDLLQKDKLNPIDYTTSRKREVNNILNKIKEEIDKIFKEEFGDKLI